MEAKLDPAQAAQKYSLWIPVNAANPSTFDVAGLAKNLGATYASPVFCPHVTVLGGLQHLELPQIMDVAKHVAEQFAPFQACITDVQLGDTYYQSVYLIFDRDSKDMLTRIHQAAVTLSASTSVDVSRYTPHISVAYGFFPLEVKESIGKAVQDHVPSMPQYFTANQVAVVKTDLSRPIDEWEILESFQFTG